MRETGKSSNLDFSKRPLVIRMQGDQKAMVSRRTYIVEIYYCIKDRVRGHKLSDTENSIGPIDRLENSLVLAALRFTCPQFLSTG